MEKSIIYACNECVQYFNQKIQLTVHKDYKHPKSVSLPRQSDQSESVTEKPGSSDVNLPEKSYLAQGNNVEIVSGVMERENEIFQQKSKIPLKMAQTSCVDPSKPVLTDSTGCERALECATIESGLFHKENEEPTVGCYPTPRPPSKANHSKAVKRKLDYSDMLKEPQNKLSKPSTTSNLSVTSGEGSCDLLATSRQTSSKNQSNKFQDNSTDRRHKCKYCEYSSKRSDHLRLHERTHTGDKPHKCAYCSYSATRNDTLRSHERTHTGVRPHKCRNCDYSSATTGGLKKHERTHTDKKPVQVSALKLQLKGYKHPKGASPSRLSDSSELVTEKRGSSNNSLPEKSYLAQGNYMDIFSSRVLDIDNEVFQQMSKISLKMAQTSYGDPSKPVLTDSADCETPLECTENQSGLFHKENEEPTIGSSPKLGLSSSEYHSKSVTCKVDFCDTFKDPQKKLSKSSPQPNFSVTSGEGSWDLLATSSQNSTKQQLNKLQDNSTERRYNCNYCEYSSNSKSLVGRHERTHTGDKPYKCEHCSYSATQRGHLRKHKRTHTGEKPNKCKYCSYSAADPTSLRKHERNHAGGKPYNCRYCNYSSTLMGILRRHERTHTGM